MFKLICKFNITDFNQFYQKHSIIFWTIFLDFNANLDRMVLKLDYQVLTCQYAIARIAQDCFP